MENDARRLLRLIVSLSEASGSVDALTLAQRWSQEQSMAGEFSGITHGAPYYGLIDRLRPLAEDGLVVVDEDVATYRAPGQPTPDVGPAHVKPTDEGREWAESDSGPD